MWRNAANTPVLIFRIVSLEYMSTVEKGGGVKQVCNHGHVFHACVCTLILNIEERHDFFKIKLNARTCALSYIF